MGSPYVLLNPPIVATEPRQPVLGPAKTLPSVPGFLQSSPLTLVGPPPQNPFFNPFFNRTFFPRGTVDATQQTNINLYQNPIPFGPYDYSEGPTRIPNASAKQFDQQPNYQNFYPNPVPFGPFDYNKVKQPPPAKEQPNWSLNINLFKNPLPFGPYDYNKVFPPLPSRPFDQQPNYPNFYPNSIPFGPYDWNKPQQPPPAKDQPVWSVNLQLYTNPIPFGPFDWSKPFALRPLPVLPALPNIALTTTVVAAPFVPYDFSKPFFPLVRIDQTQPTNINLFTNPLPFGPFDYQISHDVISAPPQAAPYNINVFTNPLPLGPYDLSRGAQTLPRLPPPPIERNPLIFSEVPLTTVDFSKPFRPQFAPQLPAPPYTISLLQPIAVPFVPLDFQKPFFPQVRVDQTQPTNPNLFQNPLPFGPYDWSARPSEYPPRAPDQTYPDLVLLQAPPPAPPFIPVDYNRPFFPRIRIDQTQPTNILVLTNPIPFGPFDYQIAHAVISAPPQATPYNILIFSNPIPLGPYDWSARPQFLPRLPPQPVERNPLIFSEVPLVTIDFGKPSPIRGAPQLPAPPYIIANLAPTAVPFIPIDWSKPFFPRITVDQTRPTNILLFINPIPLGPYDWSAHPQFLPRLPPQPIERNPLIFSEVPLVPLDWSRPFMIKGALQSPSPYNIALTTPALPPPPRAFDWSKPYPIRPVVPQSLPNLTIKLPVPPPPPLRGLDWSKPWRIIPVPPQPQPNLTLFLPPPPAIGIPALCFSKDVPVRSFTADDIALVAANAANVAGAAFKPDDIAAVQAKAQDIAAGSAKASDSPSGQNWSGAGYMAEYEIDTTIELQGVFRNELNSVYADPSTITLYILDPTGIETTQLWPGGNIVRDSLGHFHFILTPAVAGDWKYKWQGFGTAAATSPDTTFTVIASSSGFAGSLLLESGAGLLLLENGSLLLLEN
jgi:hypothetical protein